MKRNYFYFIFLIFSINKISIEYLVIPFKYLNEKKSKIYNLNDISGKDFLDFSTNKLISSISIGTPYKSLELKLTMDYKLFFIGKGYCQDNSLSTYNPLYSNSYTNKSFYPSPFDDLRNMTIGNDIISLYNDYNLKSNISLNNMQLYYGYKDNINNDNILKDKICGVLGFKLHSTENSYYNKFKTWNLLLKANNITNYSFWTIEFFGEKEKNEKNNFDGYLILGAGDNKYLKDIKNISQDDISYAYSSHLSNSIEWMINFQQIYYNYPQNNLIKMKQDLSKVELNFDIDYYFSTKQYFESIKMNFFEKYISNGICRINKLKEFYLRYQFITCDKTFSNELTNFPDLNMLSTYYNYTFQLTNKDLFMEVNNNILFLIFYNPWNPNHFIFGKNFMKKYQFIFRYDQKNIGFLKYNENINENKDTKEKRKETIDNKKQMEILVIIILSIVVIGIISGIFFLKFKWDKKRKKRANELDDENYDYDEKAYSIND